MDFGAFGSISAGRSSYTCYLLEGGNPVITRAIAENIKKTTLQRMATNVFVKVRKLEGCGKVVVYQERTVRHRVNCKHVIFAIAPMIAARVVQFVADKAQLFIQIWKLSCRKLHSEQEGLHKL